MHRRQPGAGTTTGSPRRPSVPENNRGPHRTPSLMPGPCPASRWRYPGRPCPRVCRCRGPAPARPGCPFRPDGEGHRRARVPHDRSDHHGWTGCGPGGCRGRSADLLRGGRHGRRVEDRERRDHVHACVQGRGDSVGGRRDRGAVEPECGLGRDRRAQQPAEFAVGQRRLPLHRRRAHMDASGTGEHAHNCAHPGASARSRRGVRGGGRPSLGSEPRAGGVPDHRRGGDLGTRSLYRRRHRGDRTGHGPRRPAHAICGDVPAAAAGLGIQRRRSRERHLPDHRRRGQLDRADRGASGRRHGPHRARHLPRRRQRRARAGRSGRARAGSGVRRWGRQRREERRLPLDRPRRHVGAPEHHQQPPHVLQPDSGSIRTTPSASTWAAPACFARPTADGTSPPTRQPESTSTTTPCGSIPPTPTT